MTRPVLLALVSAVMCGSTLPLDAAPSPPDGDRWLSRPVDDRTFGTYLEFFTYDRRLPFELQVTRSDEDQGLRTERLSYQSTPGVRVTALLVQPTGQAGARKPAVILLHGGGARGKDNPNVTATSALLARAGWMVLAIDMQFYGERSTNLLTTFAEQEKHDRLYNQPSVYLSWITQTAKDVNEASICWSSSVTPMRIAWPSSGSAGAVSWPRSWAGARAASQRSCSCSPGTSTPSRPPTCPPRVPRTTSVASRPGRCSW